MGNRILMLVAGILITGIIAGAQEKEMKGKKDAESVKDVVKTTAMHGYLVDAMCAKGIAKKTNVMERAAAHTRSCALEENCAASGYGVFSEGKWYKFDAKGDKEARIFLEKSKLDKEIMVDVDGTSGGNVFMVSSLKEYVPAKETGKSMKKSGGQKKY